MKEKTFETISEYLYWKYSNVAMAHTAIKNNYQEYDRIDFMIRAKLYNGLCTGKMHIRSLYDDEKIKLNKPQCSYCGNTENSPIHLLKNYTHIYKIDLLPYSYPSPKDLRL